MPVDGRKSHKITDLLTLDEIDRDMILLLECNKTKKHFNERCAQEVVEPAMSRVKAYTLDTMTIPDPWLIALRGISGLWGARKVGVGRPWLGSRIGQSVTSNQTADRDVS